VTRNLSVLVLASVSLQLLSAAVVTQSERFENLPLRFEENLGRATGGARYIARGEGYRLNLALSESWLDWKSERIRTRLLGANPDVQMDAADLLSGSANYFVGSAANWKTDVRGYGRVRYHQVYPGIDLIFHGEQSRLEYDFVLAPRANPRLIRLEISGQRGIRIDANGDLVISTRTGEIRWKRPETYQSIAGGRRPVEARFVVEHGNTVRLRVGSYDRDSELVIDPTLSYATYLGAEANDAARGIGVDAAGNVYIAGKTTSPDLPVVNAVQPAYGGSTANYFAGDAFVAKFSPAGALLYLTYLGGSRDDGATALAVDAAGNAYITGATISSDFPTAHAFQAQFQGFGGSGYARFGDAFVAKLNPSGNQLLYSTYLGGVQDDIGLAIAVDSAGNAYVAGGTLSPNFPVTNGVFQSTYQGGGGEPTRTGGRIFWDPGDAFVTKLSSAGQPVFSTFLGGTRDDVALTIAVDSSSNVYVGGWTLSSDYPTTAGAYQTSFGGTEPQNQFFNTGDGFVSKLNSAGTKLMYSTYFGGAGDDMVTAITVDGAGNAYLTGSTSTTNLKTSPGALQAGYAGYITLPFFIEQLFGDAFVAKLNSSGSAFLYLTYLGGENNDAGWAIAVDSSGNAYVTGFTDSRIFPHTPDAFQASLSGDGNGIITTPDLILYGDVFLDVVNPSGTKLVYGTYFGGTLDEGGLGLALDGTGKVYITGITLSNNLATTANAAQRTYGGDQPSVSFPMGDAFLATFSGFTAGPALSAISNSASNAVPPIAPGMVFTAYGSNLGPQTLAGAQLDSSGRLASMVSGAQMLFDGVPAPIVYAQANQFAGIVPYSVAAKSTTQVVVVYQGQQSQPLSVPVAAAAPGLYSLDFSGSGQAAAFNQDGTLNSASTPAAKGSIIIVYGTGEGVLTPVPADGSIAAAPPTWQPEQPMSLTVGGLPTTIIYANTAPQEVAGLLQVNAQLSPNTPSGSQPVVLTVGSVKSQANLTVFVQ
jgi:uncharacterized protein (TIGR03437 family)